MNGLTVPTTSLIHNPRHKGTAEPALIRLVVGTVIPFTLEKTKRRLQDRKTGHFKALTSTNHASAIADHC